MHLKKRSFLSQNQITTAPFYILLRWTSLCLLDLKRLTDFKNARK